MTNLFWGLRGTYLQRRQQLSARPREWLEGVILDSEYNNFLRSRANYRNGEKELRPGGKKLPYLGWFWRHLEFSSGALPIGFADFVGFMAKNKWDHPERMTTPEEFSSIMAIIDEAMRLNEQGGELSEIHRQTEAELDKLWPLLQSFKLEQQAA